MKEKFAYFNELRLPFTTFLHKCIDASTKCNFILYVILKDRPLMKFPNTVVPSVDNIQFKIHLTLEDKAKIFFTPRAFGRLPEIFIARSSYAPDRGTMRRVHRAKCLHIQRK